MRQRTINSVLPLVMLPFRYPITYAPFSQFSPEREASLPPTTQGFTTAHGPYPPPPPPAPSYTIPHFGVPTTFAPPPAALAARLLYFSRRELTPFPIPSHLPIDRAHAPAHEVGPTQADIAEFNLHKSTALPPLASPASARWDPDYARSLLCTPGSIPRHVGVKVYQPGTMNGLWHGRMLIPSEPALLSLLADPAYPTPANPRIVAHAWGPPAPLVFSEAGLDLTTVPLYMRVQEAYSPCAAPSNDITTTIAPGMTGTGGMRSGWFRRGDKVVDDGSSVAVGERHVYQKDYEALWSAHGLSTSSVSPLDIVLTGTTDTAHGAAWNHFAYRGRVRLFDGLVGILRESRDRRLGDLFFYGYVVGGRNLVGNWRVAFAEGALPAWEGAFSMSRRE